MNVLVAGAGAIGSVFGAPLSDGAGMGCSGLGRGAAGFPHIQSFDFSSDNFEA